MQYRFICIGIVLGGFLINPAMVHAGMPTPVLSDWAALRIETISMFIMALLIFALIVQRLWNILANDFSKLPRLTFRKALAMVILVGLFLSVVLTMIAGSRELLTPGAWQKHGLLYKVAADQASPPADKQPLSDRRQQLQQLSNALSKYAAEHDKQFPDKEKLGAINIFLWEIPETSGMRYIYKPGLTISDSRKILAYEPEIHNKQRLVLYSNGEIEMMSSSELRRELQSEAKP